MAAPTFPPARVATTRFRSRHVHKTTSTFVKAKLTELGWVVPPVNLGTEPVTFKEIQPDENGITVEANTVSISPGDLGEIFPEQLGGGLNRFVVPIFIDVYGANASVAVSIAEDIREQLGYEVILPLYDWSDVQNPVAVEGAYIEYENLLGPERPQASQVSTDFRRHWRVVKVEAHCYYGDD